MLKNAILGAKFCEDFAEINAQGAPDLLVIVQESWEVLAMDVAQLRD